MPENKTTEIKEQQSDTDFEAFRAKLGNELRSRLGKEYIFTERSTLKNNGIVRFGFEVKQETAVKEDGNYTAITIYTEEAYAKYRNGETLDFVAGELADYVRHAAPLPEFASLKPFTFERMKDSIICLLVNAGMNEKLLETVPHVRIHDLALIFRCLINHECSETATILITQSMCAAWGVTCPELVKLAIGNMQRMFPFEMEDIVDFAEKKCLANGIPFPSGMSRGTMFIANNKSHVFGSSVLVYPGVTEQIREYLGEDYYIIPSSISEVLIVPYSLGEEESMNLMVENVNSTEVAPEEVLSDHVYLYPRESFELLYDTIEQ